LEIFILAGGLSTRMGRDKSRLRLGGRTMVDLIRQTAITTGLKVRVIRRDLVRRCGPLGGIYTGLQKARADGVVFLVCDMPFITREIIEKLLAVAAAHPNRAVLLRAARKLTFPILVPREALQMVRSQIENEDWSIQSLGKRLRGIVIAAPRKWLFCLENINTPEDWERARTRMASGTRHACQMCRI